MKSFILITAILELVAGLAMAFAPQYIPDLANASELSFALANIYGAAAITIGLFSMNVYKNMGDSSLVKTWLKMLFNFHGLVTVMSLKGFINGGFENPSVAILHGIFFLITAYFGFKNK